MGASAVNLQTVKKRANVGRRKILFLLTPFAVFDPLENMKCMGINYPVQLESMEVSS